MKFQSTSLILIGIVITGSAINARRVEAQLRPIQLITGPDYNLVHTPMAIYRFDSKTGRTERLNPSTTSEGKEVTPDWVLVPDQSEGNAGEAKRYQVIEAPANVGTLVRIDTRSGRTWYIRTTPTAHWLEATVK